MARAREGVLPVGAESVRDNALLLRAACLVPRALVILHVPTTIVTGIVANRSCLVLVVAIAGSSVVVSSRLSLHA